MAVIKSDVILEPISLPIKDRRHGSAIFSRLIMLIIRGWENGRPSYSVP